MKLCSSRFSRETKAHSKHCFSGITRLFCAYARLFVEPDDGQEIVSDVMVWLWENKEMQAFESSLKVICSRLLKPLPDSHQPERSETTDRKMIFDNLQSQYDDPDFYAIQELTEKIEEALARLPENVREAF